MDEKALEETKKSHPEEYEEMLKKMQELKVENEKKLKIIIRYGNKHKLVLNPEGSNSSEKLINRNEWTAFVDVEHEKVKAEDVFDSVKFQLHPTFRNSERVVEKAPFEVSY